MVLLLQAQVQQAQMALILYLALLLLLGAVLAVDTETQREPLVVMAVQVVVEVFVKQPAQVAEDLAIHRLLLPLQHKVVMVELVVNRVQVAGVVLVRPVGMVQLTAVMAALGLHHLFLVHQ